MSKPAIFLDRDGTMNVDKGYVFRVEDWEWIPGSIEAIREFRRMGFLLIVVTNQAGIAQGQYTGEQVQQLHDFVQQDLSRHGLRIDAFYFCPHHPEHGARGACSCRKPAPGMVLQAEKEWNVDLAQSYVIGDKVLDVQLGKNTGAAPIMVLTGHGRYQKDKLTENIPVVGNLLAAMLYIRNTIKSER